MAYTSWKRLNTGDVFVVPYIANKYYSIYSSSFSENQITINVGFQNTGSVYLTDGYKTNNQYDYLVYRSIQTRYYPDFYNQAHSTGSYKQSFYIDSTQIPISNTGGFVDPGNKITTTKHFPTSSDDTNEARTILVINTPKNLIGNKITPGTFRMTINSGSIYDDGQYNLLWSGSNVSSSIQTLLSQSSYVGNIFYEQGISVLTIIPNSIELTYTPSENNTRTLATNIQPIEFKNDYTIYENFVKCTVKDYEFNASHNPTLLTGSLTSSNDTLLDFATSSLFAPYAGAVGLYNDAQELLAIAKFTNPIPISSNTDTTFLITYDT